MSTLKYTKTPNGKVIAKHRHSASDRATMVERIKDRAGQLYAKMVDGSIRKLSPLKPWANKAERRLVIKARRENREQAETKPIVEIEQMSELKPLSSGGFLEKKRGQLCLRMADTAVFQAASRNFRVEREWLRPGKEGFNRKLYANCA